jgi:hypothetical protein
VIVSSGGGYVLTAGGVSSDVQTFQREVAGAADARAAGDVDAAATRLAAAVERWQGPALAGLPGVFAEVERGRFVQVTGVPAAPIGISALAHEPMSGPPFSKTNRGIAGPFAAVS